MSEDPKHIESCRGVIKFLEATVKNVAVYPHDHPSVRGVSQRAFDHLGQILEEKKEINLGIVNGVLFVDDYQFSEATPYSESFLKILNSFEIDDLTIVQDVSQDDLLTFAGILKSAEHGREVFLRLAEERKLKNIGLKGLVVTDEGLDLTGEIVNAYHEAVSSVTVFFREVVEARLPVLDRALQVVETFWKYLAREKATLLLLPSLKGYDRYTEQHCVNVCLLSMLLADQEGLGEQEVAWAALAGLMHDAGMVKVPPQVAHKHGSLTLAERETFKSHPVHSAGIVHGMGGPDEVVYAVERHHVHHGGGGYPAGLDSIQEPPLAGIVSIADTYDAVTALRPYKRAMDPVEALAFLEKGSGTVFDPVHVKAFKAMTGPWPPGSVVRLTSNEIGAVIRAAGPSGQPVIRMLVDENGTVLQETWELDLAEDEVQGRTVAGVVDPALYNLAPEVVFK